MSYSPMPSLDRNRSKSRRRMLRAPSSYACQVFADRSSLSAARACVRPAAALAAFISAGVGGRGLGIPFVHVNRLAGMTFERTLCKGLGLFGERDKNLFAPAFSPIALASESLHRAAPVSFCDSHDFSFNFGYRVGLGGQHIPIGCGSVSANVAARFTFVPSGANVDGVCKLRSCGVSVFLRIEKFRQGIGLLDVTQSLQSHAGRAIDGVKPNRQLLGCHANVAFADVDCKISHDFSFNFGYRVGLGRNFYARWQRGVIAEIAFRVVNRRLSLMHGVASAMTHEQLRAILKPGASCPAAIVAATSQANWCERFDCCVGHDFISFKTASKIAGMNEVYAHIVGMASDKSGFYQLFTKDKHL